MTDSIRAMLHTDFYVEFQDLDEPTERADIERLDALLGRLELIPLGKSWEAISAEQAALLLDDVLGEDLMGGFRVRHPEAPERILARFMASFDAGSARFYTNVHSWREDDASHWTPFTRGGLCVCVAGCDGRQVGMLWTDQ
jgi:hypothetical protein